MAYGLKKIAPVDLKKSTALGVKVPFNAPSVFQSAYTTKDQIRYNIINYLLTNHRERVFDPNFGANLRAKIFEQIAIENISDIETSIKSNIESNFPVQLTQIVITPMIDTDNAIIIQFSYRLLSSNAYDNVIITIQNS